MSKPLLLFMALALGAGIVAIFVPLIERLCRKRGWLDRPRAGKIHPQPTPRLTGIALYLALWTVLLTASILAPAAMAEFNAHAFAFWAGGLAILVVGIIDDLRPLTSIPKLAVEIAVGSLLYWSGMGFDRLWIPFVGGVPLGVLSWPVTLLWFLIVVNAVNIIDGLDGLAASTTAIGAATLVWISWDLHLPAVWVGAAALVGGLLVFLRFNRPPARVFMGDSGALSLGYFFAIVALFAPIKRFTALAFFVPILALLIPLLESVLSVGRRTWAGTNPLRGDTGHLHHQLLAAGYTPRQILIYYNLVAFCVGCFCVAFRYANRRVTALLLGIFVLSVLGGLGIILRRRSQG